MAVPRPVLLAILGLALCVTALVAVGGLGAEDDALAPTPLPTTPPAAEQAQSAQPGARGRARSRPQAEPATPAEPTRTRKTEAKPQPKAEPRGAQKLSKSEVAKLKDKAQVAAVGKALGQNDVVVLFFARPGAADSTGAESAVKPLRKVDGVQVFSPRFEDLDNYRPVLAGVGVSQVPAIVIVRPGNKAQLVEGYVDRKSLRQQVEDARR